jgi:hypothetical protein
MGDGLFKQLTSVEKVVAIVSAIALSFTTWRANTIQNRVTEQQAAINELKQRQELDLTAKKQNNELTEEIFKEFVGAITDANSPALARLSRLEGVLVLTYAIGDPRQQEGMGRAVKSAIERLDVSPHSETATRVTEATFDADELVLNAVAQQRMPVTAQTLPANGGAVHWGNYDFDVFWCAGVPESSELESRAKQVTGLRALDASASGRWRTRPLPKMINERAGYGVSGYQIRFSGEDERVLAQALKSQIETTFAGKTVVLEPSGQRTPWYLSVFLCP